MKQVKSADFGKSSSRSGEDLERFLCEIYSDEMAGNLPQQISPLTFALYERSSLHQHADISKLKAAGRSEQEQYTSHIFRIAYEVTDRDFLLEGYRQLNVEKREAYEERRGEILEKEQQDIGEFKATENTNQFGNLAIAGHVQETPAVAREILCRILKPVDKVSERQVGQNDAFLHFYNREQYGEVRHRIYLNLLPEQITSLMRHFIEEVLLDTENDAFGFKVHTSLVVTQRRSGRVVVYIRSDTGLEKTITWLRDYHAANQTHFLPQVPRLTLPIEHGISLASEPGQANAARALELLKRDHPDATREQMERMQDDAQESFGQSRASAISEAILSYRQLSPGDRGIERLRELVMREFERRAIDFSNPHRNSA